MRQMILICSDSFSHVLGIPHPAAQPPKGKSGNPEGRPKGGQRDAEQLTIYGLAYLTELHEGQDPRFTDC